MQKEKSIISASDFGGWKYCAAKWKYEFLSKKHKIRDPQMLKNKLDELKEE